METRGKQEKDRRRTQEWVKFNILSPTSALMPLEQAFDLGEDMHYGVAQNRGEQRYHGLSVFRAHSSLAVPTGCLSPNEVLSATTYCKAIWAF